MRVNWVLGADASVATTRLHGLLLVEALRPLGVRTRVLSQPPFALMDAPWPPDRQDEVARLVAGEIVVLQKLRGPNAEALADRLRTAGTPTVFVHGDYEPDNPVVLKCDAFVGSSRRLTDFWRERGAANAHYIPDPAEWWCERSEIDGGPREPGVVRLAWMGHRANWETLAPLRALISEPEFRDLRLVTVANHPEADVAWSPEAVQRVVASCDIGVVTTRPPPVSTVKSSNRVVQFMAAGKPVVADRIPSYEEVVRQGETGFLCDSLDDWREALRELRDPERRQAVATAARDTVDPDYRVETIARRWLEVFRTLHVDPTQRRGRLEAWRLRAAVRYWTRRYTAS
jgi:glycosyltransferase involved in cell wall biosynthesis